MALNHNLTNDKTNTYFGQTYAKKEDFIKNLHKTNMSKNNDEILLHSNIIGDSNSVIEVKLPNPYLYTGTKTPNQYINYNINSKFKSKFADYIQNTSHQKSILSENKSELKSIEDLEDKIYFTNINIKK